MKDVVVQLGPKVAIEVTVHDWIAKISLAGADMRHLWWNFLDISRKICIYDPKMEDWDLVDHDKFPHLATNKYMTKIYYEEIGVTWLEPNKWVRDVEQASLLHMLYIPHFHQLIINIVCVC